MAPMCEPLANTVMSTRIVMSSKDMIDDTSMDQIALNGKIVYIKIMQQGDTLRTVPHG